MIRPECVRILTVDPLRGRSVQCDTCGSWPDKVASVSINGGDGEFTICQGCLAAIDFDLNAPQGVRDRRKIQ